MWLRSQKSFRGKRRTPNFCNHNFKNIARCLYKWLEFALFFDTSHICVVCDRQLKNGLMVYCHPLERDEYTPPSTQWKNRLRSQEGSNQNRFGIGRTALYLVYMTIQCKTQILSNTSKFTPLQVQDVPPSPTCRLLWDIIANVLRKCLVKHFYKLLKT